MPVTVPDETLWHQLPSTFDHLGTSDPRFFDRHWFAVYDPKGGRALQFTMGVYSNMNVVDAGLVIIIGDKQHNVRSSRSLRPLFEMACDPFKIEILKPMEKVRVEIAPGPHGISGELIFDHVTPIEEEPTHFVRKNGRITDEYCRYDQVGTVSGWLDIKGSRVEIDKWWSARDHSWGLRAGHGVEEPVTSAEDARAVALIKANTDAARGQAWGQVSDDQQFLKHLIFFTTPKISGHVVVFYEDGIRYRMDGMFNDRSVAGCPRLHAREAAMSVALTPGTLRFSAMALALTLDDGREIELRADALGSAIVMAGLGYSGGFNDGKGLGVWRGDHYVEFETWDVSHIDRVVRADGSVMRPLHRLQPVTVTAKGAGFDGVGTGSVTLVFNSLPPDVSTLQQ